MIIVTAATSGISPGKDVIAALDSKKDARKKIFWAIVSFLIAVASIAAVIWQSRSFKLSDFFAFVTSANPLFIAAAVVCMLFYILLEGEALRIILKSYGNPVTHRSAAFYSATDLYFSAITPSATGGQPASAYMMIRDGIPGSTATIALLANIVMYTASILVIGVAAFFLYPSVFFSFAGVSRVLVYLGIVLQSFLLAFFLLLLSKEKLLRKLAIGAVKLGGKLHLIRRVDERIEKITSSLDNYARDVRALQGHRPMLLKVFLINIAQRASQIAVTSFVYLAMIPGATFSGAVQIFALQCYVVLGASYMPIPGAMGVTDFLMLDAFGTMLAEEAATSLELLSRSLSFYCCIALCAVCVLVRLLSWKKKDQL